MGWFTFLSGKRPEEIEKTGDGLMADGLFGHAKVEYENALHRHGKKPSDDPGFGARIEGKIRDAREALAQEHVRNGRELIEAACPEDALELLELAGELTERDDLRTEIEALTGTIEAERKASLARRFRVMDEADDDGEDDETWENDDEDPDDPDDPEYLDALLAALPPEERKAYAGYGEAFLTGYAALNRGDFETAADHLSQALRENGDATTLIPLELATCYLNLGENEAARTTIEPFLADFPEIERAYPILCESLWALGEYDRAAEVLAGVPEELADRPTIVILKGETLVQAGKYGQAEAYYTNYLRENDRNEFVVRALADIHMKKGDPETATGLYGELLNGCTGCGRRPDPELRRLYADAAFDAGHRTERVLELYLGLAREEPANRSAYLGRASRIYAAMGNDAEAARFEALSRDDAPSR